MEKMDLSPVVPRPKITCGFVDVAFMQFSKDKPFKNKAVY